MSSNKTYIERLCSQATEMHMLPATDVDIKSGTIKNLLVNSTKCNRLYSRFRLKAKRYKSAK